MLIKQLFFTNIFLVLCIAQAQSNRDSQIDENFKKKYQVNETK
ncbi:MAG: hypothetical protein ACI9XR_002530 [Flavobacterium sp.]|jgi:hypothetical protein